MRDTGLPEGIADDLEVEAAIESGEVCLRVDQTVRNAGSFGLSYEVPDEPASVFLAAVSLQDGESLELGPSPASLVDGPPAGRADGRLAEVFPIEARMEAQVMPTDRIVAIPLELGRT